MKQFMILAALIIFGLTANAQISNLDEIELQGNWEVIGFGGEFSNINVEYRGNTPKTLELKDGNYTIFRFPNTDWIFKGYWLSTTQSGKYILHLLPWNGDESILNFVITKFDGGLLSVTTYDGNGWIEFKKQDISGIKQIPTNGTYNKTYTISGIEVTDTETAKGVLIQNGKKVFR